MRDTVCHVLRVTLNTGCLPTLATIPIFIGLYSSLTNAANEGLFDTQVSAHTQTHTHSDTSIIVLPYTAHSASSGGLKAGCSIHTDRTVR